LIAAATTSHAVNHFVVERKVIDQQNRNSCARIEDEGRPARPTVDANLVDAEAKKVCAE
jgi:hypothetical protein